MGTSITVQGSTNGPEVQDSRAAVQIGIKTLVNNPKKIKVRFSSGCEREPLAIETKTGHMQSVAEIQDRWRIDDEWWHVHAIARMYFQCILDNGSQKIVFRDLCTGQWYQHIK